MLDTNRKNDFKDYENLILSQSLNLDNYRDLTAKLMTELMRVNSLLRQYQEIEREYYAKRATIENDLVLEWSNTYHVLNQN